MRLFKTAQIVLISQVTLFAPVSAFAFSGGFGSTTSGGASSSGNGTSSCSSIGAPAAGTGLSGGFQNISGSGAGACAGQDSDGDSMPDTWEMTYALNKYNSLDRYADGDSDNCTNACEYARSGIPNDDDSDNDGIKDMDDSNITGIGATANGTYKGRKITSSNVAE